MSEPFPAHADGVAPLRRLRVDVAAFYPAPVRRVFMVFTNEVDRWWTYRIRDGARSVIETQAGGRWLQAWENGELLFGHFTLWDPPHHIRLAGPLAMEGFAQNVVDIYFNPVEEGTRLELHHRGWGELDEGADDLYRSGWVDLLEGPFRDHLSRS